MCDISKRVVSHGRELSKPVSLYLTMLYLRACQVTVLSVPYVPQITVTFPKLSQQPQDWLYIPTDSQNLPPSSPRPEDKFCFPPFVSSSLQTWLAGSGLARSASSQASLQQWLCDLHQQAVGDEEEMDRDMDFQFVSQPTQDSGACLAVWFSIWISPSVMKQMFVVLL